MTSIDLIKMTLQNLLRRKARTMLTVLGVIIGCCSIVIMISIGIGMKESQEAMLSEMGDLTIITVSPPQGGAQKKLDREALDAMKVLGHVEAVSPKMTLEVGNPVLYAGQNRRFMADYVTMVGMDPESVERFGYSLAEGDPLTKNSKGILVGNFIEYNFKDTLRPEGYNMISRYPKYDAEDPESIIQTEPEVPEPYFDALKEPLQLELELSDDKKVSLGLKVTGRLKEDMARGYETGEGIVLPLKQLEDMLKANNLMPKKDQGYQTVLVKVTSMEKVTEVETAIMELGYPTHSMDSIRKPLEKEARQKQLMLGGLGGISLLVAAIGITNTMIMSISERTREIGIMKALGCYVSDIRAIFLSEAGAIGLIGGILGSIISLIVSLIMNTASGGSEILGIANQSGAARISVIPLWLIGFAILFSVLIGLISGYYPANKAVRISALEAMRND